MTRTVRACSLDLLNPDPINVEVVIPPKCPRCGVAYDKEPIESYYFKNPDRILYSIYFCPSCGNGFFTEGPVLGNFSNEYKSLPLLCYPQQSSLTQFPDPIRNLSPDFVEIYHQAEQAENSGLTLICGAGYRKALEFLVKDYAISQFPEDTDTIKASPLTTCISNYIYCEDIRVLANRSTWLGNDEVHYIKKHEDYSYVDMKEFINAAVYFIGMKLSVTKAESISRK